MECKYCSGDNGYEHGVCFDCFKIFPVNAKNDCPKCGSSHTVLEFDTAYNCEFTFYVALSCLHCCRELHINEYVCDDEMTLTNIPKKENKS